MHVAGEQDTYGRMHVTRTNYFWPLIKFISRRKVWVWTKGIDVHHLFNILIQVFNYWIFNIDVQCTVKLLVISRIQQETLKSLWMELSELEILVLWIVYGITVEFQKEFMERKWTQLTVNKWIEVGKMTLNWTEVGYKIKKKVNWIQLNFDQKKMAGLFIL